MPLKSGRPEIRLGGTDETAVQASVRHKEVWNREERLMRTHSITVVCVMTVLCGMTGACRGANGWANALKPKGKASAPLTLAEGGKTDYAIVVPAKPTSQEDKAAALLGVWLEDTTGATFPATPDSTAPRPREICVGRTNRFADEQQDLGTKGTRSRFAASGSSSSVGAKGGRFMRRWLCSRRIWDAAGTRGP